MTAPSGRPATAAPLTLRPGRVSTGTTSRMSALGVALLALAVSAPSLTHAFTLDDMAIIATDGRIHRLQAPWRFFTQPYWPDGPALFRPLTSLAFAVEWQLGHGAPWVYHAVNLLLYAAVCLAVYRLAIDLLGEFGGWWAAAFFAVHPVHVEAVANSVGQAELWAGLCAVGAMGYYVGARRGQGPLRFRDGAVVTVLYATGCLFKEHVIMLPGLILAAEVTLLGQSVTALFRRRDLCWLLLMLVATAAAFWGVHIWVVGYIAGDHAALAFVGMSHRDRLLTMLGVVPEWGRLLFLPLDLRIDYMPQQLPLAHGLGWRQLAGILLLLGVAALAVRARTRQPVLTFAVLWAAVTIFPVSNTVIPSGIILAERTLFLPSVAAALSVGVFARWLGTALQSRWNGGGRATIAIGSALIAFWAVRTILRQRVWRDNETLWGQMLVDAPRSYRSHWLYARRLYASGDSAGGKRELDRALSLFRDDPRLLVDAADRHLAADRCGEAVPLYRRSLRLAPATRFARGRLIRCLLRLGRLQEARAEASSALALGEPGAQRALMRVDSIVSARQARTNAHR
jgi:protein O-mannosyl-transferase